MKIITHDMINGLNISVKQCYEWTANMIKEKSEMVLPPKTSLTPYEGAFCNFMPAIIESNGRRVGGVKIVTRYPNSKPSLDSKILIFNADTGEELAMLDGNWITAMRTGTVAAHSIELLAKKEYKKIGIIGLGNVGRATLLALNEENLDKELTIKILKYREQEYQYIEYFRKFPNLKFEIVNNAFELIKETDVVISAVTYLAEDICTDDAFDEGVLVVPIHTRGFTNCDLFFDKVFADDTDSVRGFKNFASFKSFAEISDVVNKRAQGRSDDKERILVYNIGIGIHDINYAINIYDMLSKRGVEMQDVVFSSLEKYWI